LTYGSRATVKVKLGIASTNTDHDTEIDNLLAEATRYIDSALKASDIAGSSCDELNDVANALAGGWFNEQQEVASRGRAETTDALTLRGKDMLKRYIDGYAADRNETEYPIYKVNG